MLSRAGAPHWLVLDSIGGELLGTVAWIRVILLWGSGLMVGRCLFWGLGLMHFGCRCRSGECLLLLTYMWLLHSA